MIESIFLAALTLGLQPIEEPAAEQAAPEQAQTPEQPPAQAIDPSSELAALPQQARAALRCSAAFAILANAQETGVTWGASWPLLAGRGREYFVVSLARLMDDSGLTREEVAALVAKEARSMVEAREVDEVMPACFLLLEAAKL